MFKLCATTVARGARVHGTLHLEKRVRHQIKIPASIQWGPLTLLSVALGRPTACKLEHAVLPS